MTGSLDAGRRGGPQPSPPSRAARGPGLSSPAETPQARCWKALGTARPPWLRDGVEGSLAPCPVPAARWSLTPQPWLQSWLRGSPRTPPPLSSSSATGWAPGQKELMTHQQQGALRCQIYFLPCLEPPAIPLHPGYRQGLCGPRIIQDTPSPPWDSPQPQPVQSWPSSIVPECPACTTAEVTSVKQWAGR